MPWSSRPTSDFLRWTQFFLCDVCLLIFDSKKRLQYLNLLNHHTTYSNLTKKQGEWKSRLFCKFLTTIHSQEDEPGVRKTRHNSSLSDLGVATKLGHKVDWGKSGNLVNLFDIQNLQSHVLIIYIRHSKFWHLSILIWKLPQCLATKWNSKWLLMDSSTYTKTFKICNSFNGHFKYILMYCSAKPHWCVTGKS